MAVNHPLLLWSMGLLATCAGGAQTLVQPVAARYAGLSAYSVQFADIYGAGTNPASLQHLPASALGVYTERRFMLKNLNFHSVSAGIKTSSGSFGFLGSYLGFAQQNMAQGAIAYGRKLNARLDAGAILQLHQIRQSGIYGGATTVSGSLGLLMHPTEQVHLGVSVHNPFGAALGKTSMDPLPSQYHFGIGWDATDQTHFSLEMVKEEDKTLNVNAGIIYRFIPQFFVRAGIATQTSGYFFGLGLLPGSFRTDIALSYHPFLGWTPGFLVLFNIGKNEAKTAANEAGGGQ